MAGWELFVARLLLALAPMAKNFLSIYNEWSARRQAAQFQLSSISPPPSRVQSEGDARFLRAQAAIKRHDASQTILSIPMTSGFEETMNPPPILSPTVHASPQIFQQSLCGTAATKSTYSFQIVLVAVLASLVLGFVLGLIVTKLKRQIVMVPPLPESLPTHDVSTCVIDPDNTAHLPDLAPLFLPPALVRLASPATACQTNIEQLDHQIETFNDLCCDAVIKAILRSLDLPNDHPVPSKRRVDKRLEVSNFLDQTRDCERTSSPVNSLPAEILCEIFSYSLPYDFDDWDGSRTTLDVETFTPWKLAQVSKFWRETVIGLSWLWAEIHIGDSVFQTLECDRGEHTLHLLDTQIQRSGNRSLVLCLDLGQELQKPAQMILDRLLLTSPRWKRFYLCAHTLESFESLTPIQNRLDTLEVLSLWCSESLDITSLDSDSPETPSFSRIFANAPRLRSLEGDSECLRLLSAHAMPWSQILYYHEEDTYEYGEEEEEDDDDETDESAETGFYQSPALFYASNLRECTINHNPDWQLPPEEEYYPLEFPALEILTIVGDDLENVDEWLALLSMPKLEMLFFEGELDMEVLPDALQRLPTLEGLGLQISSFDSFTVRILEATVNLKTLELHPTGPETVGSLGHLVSLIASRPDVCPGLEEIVFGAGETENFQCETLDKNSEVFKELRASRPKLILGDYNDDR